MIELLRSYEDSATLALLFRWQGMTICLVGTLNEEGEKSLNVSLDDAGTVELTTDGIMATWNISRAAEAHSVAGAPITSAGDAQSAT